VHYLQGAVAPQTFVKPAESAPKAPKKSTPSAPTNVYASEATEELSMAYAAMRKTAASLGATQTRIKIVTRMRLIAQVLRGRKVNLATI